MCVLYVETIIIKYIAKNYANANIIFIKFAISCLCIYSQQTLKKAHHIKMCVCVCILCWLSCKSLLNIVLQSSHHIYAYTTHIPFAWHQWYYGNLLNLFKKSCYTTSSTISFFFFRIIIQLSRNYMLRNIKVTQKKNQFFAISVILLPLSCGETQTSGGR